MNRFLVGALAVIGGGFLAGMIGINSNLAAFTSPLIASWVAHGVGAIVAFFLFLAIRLRLLNKRPAEIQSAVPPKWAYLGGIPGAMTVVLAAFTVNSDLGLTGTIVLSIVGQTLFGMACDHYGWFGLRQRPLNRIDLMTVVFTVSGSLLVVTA